MADTEDKKAKKPAAKAATPEGRCAKGDKAKAPKAAKAEGRSQGRGKAEAAPKKAAEKAPPARLRKVFDETGAQGAHRSSSATTTR